MSVAVVSLDLWGTVLGFGDRAAAAAWRLTEFDRVLTAFGHQVARDRLGATIRHVAREFLDRQRHTGAQPTIDEQVNAILTALAVPTEPDLLQVLTVVHSSANLRACPAPTDGIPAVLARLRAEGHRLVLSSNTLTCPGAVTRRILDDHNLIACFDQLLFSDELGVAKPAAGFFAAVTTAAGVPPQLVLHIGDDWRTDVHGAAAADMTVAWFNPTGKPRPTTLPGEAIRVAELEHLSALPNLAAGHRLAAVPATRHSPGDRTQVTPR